MNALILVRGIGFLFNNDVRMRCHKIFVIKRDVPDDTQPVGNNAKLEDIAEMPIDIQLPDFRIGRSMGRHGAIGSFVGIIRFIKPLSFCICLELPDDSVSVLWIIFRNKGFNAGGIKDGHVGFDRIDCLTDRLGDIHKVIEDGLQIFKKVLFESGDFRSIRNFDKTTEFTERF